MTKAKLLESMQRGRVEWEALLEQVGEQHMNESDVVGEWSPKDLIVHITTWERWAAALLEAALQGKTATQTELYGRDLPTEIEESEGIDLFNEWMVAQNRGRSLDDVRAESRQVYQRLLEATRACPEEDLIDPQRILTGFEWKGTDRPLWQILAGQNFKHYQLHAQAIQDWLNREIGD